MEWLSNVKHNLDCFQYVRNQNFARSILDIWIYVYGTFCPHYLSSYSQVFMNAYIFTFFSNRCNGCQMKPVTGPRFKCKTCDNFDFCEPCFRQRRNHRHPFVRISEPGTKENKVGNCNKYDNKLKAKTVQ